MSSILPVSTGSALLINRIKSKVQIDKGWSCDTKYRISCDDGVDYLLRISPKDRSAFRVKMVAMMKRVAVLNVPMCKPVEDGECAEGYYSIQSWVDGDDAIDVIATLPDAEQYSYGLEAGRILKLIHSIPAPIEQEAWEPRFNRKLDRKIKNYDECPIKYEKGQLLIDYINKNRSLLRNRPQCFQHGDYHVGNMMLSNGDLIIIDFDRYDFGDPWEEFNRIVWCADLSPIFASGYVNGYFGGNARLVPLEFWKLLALYIASNTLSSLPWAVSFGEREIATMKNQANQILDWYDDMKNPIPKWYIRS